MEVIWRNRFLIYLRKHCLIRFGLMLSVIAIMNDFVSIVGLVEEVDIHADLA